MKRERKVSFKGTKGFKGFIYLHNPSITSRQSLSIKTILNNLQLQSYQI